MATAEIDAVLVTLQWLQCHALLVVLQWLQLNPKMATAEIEEVGCTTGHAPMATVDFQNGYS